MTAFRLLAAALLAAVSFSACNQDKSGAASSSGPVTLRVGYFPNITHAQGLIAAALSREGKGWFEERLGPGTKIEWFVYNAGPSAMEALAINSIDLTYVGPNPALNLYTRAKGDEVRIIAGSAEGGAALVVQPDGPAKPEDFRGKSIATPQFGNTQDVACRVWLKKQGFNVTQLGGDVKVLATANPDALANFIRKEVTGVWTVEPWVSRLELEGSGRIFLEQKEEITTVLVSSVAFLEKRADLAKKFAAAHAELTEWINKNPEEAKRLANAQFKEITKRAMPTELIDKSWPRLRFTTEIKKEALDHFVSDAQGVGFLNGAPDLGRLIVKP